MRFLADGPDIPDVLLHERDDGKVVFLCGAGVSHPAGLPLFEGLAKEVAESFPVPADSEIARALNDRLPNGERIPVPLDHVFQMMQDQYGAEEVDRYITEILMRPTIGSVAPREHRLIAEISTNRVGEPQIVTTNFDRLFECGARAAGKKFRHSYVAPMMPNLDAGVSITGITYLHGRLQPKSMPRYYMTSTSDFGRAYLAEGWATAFVRSLLEKHTVVFVGYQAAEPLMRYLLQGLRGREERRISNLYAFDHGAAGEVQAKWSSRGVTAIAYQGGDDHKQLWDTFEVWAQRAKSPETWRGQVIEIATKSPRDCEPYQRGQVAHMVRTTGTAKEFADSKASPEWICVFDPVCRLGEPREVQELGKEREPREWFNPFEEYGLDSDKPVCLDYEGRRISQYDDLLGRLPRDENPDQQHRVSSTENVGWQATPPRIEQLMIWFTKRLSAPIMVWWATRRHRLHPVLIRGIREALEQVEEHSPQAAKAWRIVLEYQEDRRGQQRRNSLTEIESRVGHGGWTPSVIRDFEDLSGPYLEPIWTGSEVDPRSLPSLWPNINPNKIMRLQVSFPHGLDRKLFVRDCALYDVFVIVERHLRRASSMLKDIGEEFFQTPACDSVVDDNNLNDGTDRVFLLFVELFNRMVEHYPAKARAHAVGWSVQDPYFFHKLKLFALGKNGLFSTEEAAEEILGFSQDAFWDYGIYHGFVQFLRDRWNDWTDDQRHRLAARLLKGPDKGPNEAHRKFLLRRKLCIGYYADWLLDEKYKMSKAQRRRLKRMIDSIPNWHGSGTAEPVTESGREFGFVGKNTDSRELRDVPVSEVVERAEALSRLDIDELVEHEPFAGLVGDDPQKALDALVGDMKKGKYPIQLWAQLIRSWPTSVEESTQRDFIKALCKLPAKHVYDVSGFLGEWIWDRITGLFVLDEKLAWRLVDHAAQGMRSNEMSASDEEQLESGPCRTHHNAINNPLGRLTRGLLNALRSEKVNPRSKLPAAFAKRFIRLTSKPGEDSDWVISVLAGSLGDLYALDQEWTVKHVLPWLDMNHPSAQPAWSGFRYCPNQFPQELSEKLNGYFASAFPAMCDRGWEGGVIEVAARGVISLTCMCCGQTTGLTKDEVRNSIRNMNSNARDHAIFQLRREAEKCSTGWREFFIPFVQKVWPAEREHRSDDNTMAWVQVLAYAGEDFPQAVKAVKHLLTRVTYTREYLWLYTEGGGRHQSLATKHPEAVLELLDAVVSNDPKGLPYGLKHLMRIIREKGSSVAGDSRWVRLSRLVE